MKWSVHHRGIKAPLSLSSVRNLQQETPILRSCRRNFISESLHLQQISTALNPRGCGTLEQPGLHTQVCKYTKGHEHKSQAEGCGAGKCCPGAARVSLHTQVCQHTKEHEDKCKAEGGGAGKRCPGAGQRLLVPWHPWYSLWFCQSCAGSRRLASPSRTRSPSVVTAPQPS